jgi:hypothetical protein
MDDQRLEGHRHEREPAAEDASQAHVAEGGNYLRMLDAMLESAAGRKQQAGDYWIAYAVEPAQGLYRLQDGHWQWVEPTTENTHIQIMVADRYDGRFIPELEIYAVLFDPDHNEIGERRQYFHWHPELHHYGRNWTIAKSGAYRLRVRIEIPDFARHGKKEGARYEEPVEVEFRQIHIDAPATS